MKQPIVWLADRKEGSAIKVGRLPAGKCWRRSPARNLHRRNDLFLCEQEGLVSRVGLIAGEVISNGEAKEIGGNGGMMMHLENQGKG
ncbi:MAG: hypothetical protein AB1607_15955 [Chloroflexota bacterium]